MSLLLLLDLPSCKIYLSQSLSVLLTIISIFLIIITFPISLFMCIKVETPIFFFKSIDKQEIMLGFTLGGPRIRESSNL